MERAIHNQISSPVSKCYTDLGLDAVLRNTLVPTCELQGSEEKANEDLSLDKPLQVIYRITAN
jgi:hypothetical protein